MSWVKLCDTLHGHPKALKAGFEAIGLWTFCMSYSGAYLLDGVLDRDVVARIGGARADELAQRLVDAGLWEETPTGYRVHNYLRHNPTKAEDAARKAERRESGRRGGLASARSRKQNGSNSST